MARGSERGYSNRNRLTIPPVSLQDWLHLAAWELWAGMLLCGLLGFGLLFIVTAPDRIVVAEDLSACYAATVVLPCERLVYMTGGLNAMFSVLIGAMSLAAGLAMAVVPAMVLLVTSQASTPTKSKCRSKS